MQRARQVAQQETNGDQVKKHPEGARDAVVRNPALAVHVLDGHFADGSSMPRGQGRDKAMQLAVERDLVQNFPAIGLEGRTKVVNVHAAQLGHQPVGAAGRQAAEPEVVNAALAPAADDVVALGNLFQKNGDIGRIMLQVAIHGDDIFAAGVIEAGSQR